MKDNLSSVANITHVLLNARKRRNIKQVSHNTYKHPRLGFMFRLDPKGEEGLRLLYGACIYYWGHFLVSTPTAFQDLT
ncbi:unnamed protein product [Rhizoctonia solani]|uniref:Uncharacterized protein n=1 Tax=Rhizoctonia solani TaxID=456999 RepID=A0A8H3GWJ2_9AGAM|nr:unnamed protein product [Rhizoctonia solani]